MNNQDDLEEFITANAQHQRILAEKIEKEIMEKRKKIAQVERTEIRSIKDVPPEVLFGRNSVWNVVNLHTLIEFELHGINVSLYLGQNEPLRQLLLAGEIDSFTRDNLYIKFKKAFC